MQLMCIIYLQLLYIIENVNYSISAQSYHFKATSKGSFTGNIIRYKARSKIACAIQCRLAKQCSAFEYRKDTAECILAQNGTSFTESVNGFPAYTYKDVKKKENPPANIFSTLSPVDSQTTSERIFTTTDSHTTNVHTTDHAQYTTKEPCQSKCYKRGYCDANGDSYLSQYDCECMAHQHAGNDCLNYMDCSVPDTPLSSSQECQNGTIEFWNSLDSMVLLKNFTSSSTATFEQNIPAGDQLSVNFECGSRFYVEHSNSGKIVPLWSVETSAFYCAIDASKLSVQNTSEILIMQGNASEEGKTTLPEVTTDIELKGTTIVQVTLSTESNAESALSADKTTRFNNPSEKTSQSPTTGSQVEIANDIQTTETKTTTNEPISSDIKTTAYDMIDHATKPTTSDIVDSSGSSTITDRGPVSTKDETVQPKPTTARSTTTTTTPLPEQDFVLP